MKSLLLKFAGPLQSWGTGSHFETRMTDLYPSKSAVIGLVAAALGYRRDEDEKTGVLNGLDFAVRIDQPGTLLKDYQIVHSTKRNYVTERYYLEDAVYIAALSGTDPEWVEEIEEALNHPYFQSSFGRRSAVPTYDFIMGTVEGGPIEALQKCEWQASKWYKRIQGETVHLEIFADGHLLDSRTAEKRQDRVLSFSQKSRQFGFRYEKRKIIEIQNPEKSLRDTFESGYLTEHDAFAMI